MYKAPVRLLSFPHIATITSCSHWSFPDTCNPQESLGSTNLFFLTTYSTSVLLKLGFPNHYMIPATAHHHFYSSSSYKVQPISSHYTHKPISSSQSNLFLTVLFNPDEFPKNIILLTKNEVYKPVTEKEIIKDISGTLYACVVHKLNVHAPVQ